jgi:tetratricopeptide (TPR) repeat protein
LSSPRFEVRRTLGEGAYGIVYEAFDRERGVNVAVKALTRFAPDALARFKTEFRALADLSHPNLVQLHELIEHEGTWLIVMELVHGEDFWSHVRVPEHVRAANHNALPYRENRLREALIQLADGLETLHRQNLVHRDLKPSNMRITPQGRLVLLDFGLVAELDRKQGSDDAAAVGSAGYMAPEQAQGRFGPPADWYAVGALLFEALTGTLPFQGISLQIILNKQRERAPLPSTLLPQVAEDLDLLCGALLDPNPDARPDAEEVRQQLAAGALPKAAQPFAANAPFAGRAEELKTLEDTLERVRRGKSCRVIVEGESGVGKTALVQEFLQRVQARDPEAWILRGRCFELEAVPLKGIDGVVDTLARYMSELTREQCEQLLPRRSALLPRLFPVLGAILPANKSGARDEVRDPSVLRREAMDALFEFFERIAERRLLVIVIDDLQWADVETFRLLSELDRREEGASILLLTTCRPRTELDEPARQWVSDLHASAGIQVLSLTGLPQEEARTLSAQLLETMATPEWIGAVAEKSQGHPLLISELARFVATTSPSSAESLSLEAALDARLTHLEKGTRELLELVVLAGRPRSLATFAGALGRPPEQLSNAVATLRAARLVSTGQSGRLRCFHDRVRLAITRLIPAQVARARHCQLALALENLADGDFHAAVHWQQAGELARAVPLFERAAERAVRGLTFERAAALYERLLAMNAQGRSPGWRQDLRIKRAHALAEAGRSLEAANAYLGALAEADREQSLELRRYAAQHLLQGAQVREGIRVLTELAADMHLSLPGGSKMALLKLVWHRTLLGFRGLDSTPRDASEITPATLSRLELLHGLSPGLTWIDLFRGAELGARHLRLALACGDRHHTVIALAAEALVNAIQPRDVPPRSWELINRARHLARDLDDPSARAFVHLSYGQIMQCQWRVGEAIEELERAEQVYSERPRVDWHQSVSRTFLLSLLGLAGDYPRHAQLIERWLSEARARDDRFAVSNYVLLGLGSYRYLRRDKVELAQREIEEAVAHWPDDHVGMPHFGAFCASGVLFSYASWTEAHARSERAIKRLLRTPLAYPRFVRASMLQVHAMQCLGAAAACTGEQRMTLIREGSAYASRIARVHEPTRAISELVHGSFALLRGEVSEARTLYARVVVQLDKLGATQWARQVRVGLACCDGPRARDAALEKEARWLEAQGFENVERALRWLYPIAHAAI